MIKILKSITIIMIALCLLLFSGDIFFTKIPNYNSEIITHEVAMHVPNDNGYGVSAKDVTQLEEDELSSDSIPISGYSDEGPFFDPMSLIDTDFYIYQPKGKINLYSNPNASRVHKIYDSRYLLTYAGAAENGFYKVIDKNGGVYFVKDYEWMSKVSFVKRSSFAVTQVERIPRNALAFEVKYNGDRVLRLTKSINLKDNIAGVIEKGETVYKLRDYGQIFYVALEDGTAGYMNSQCLEIKEPLESPYEIVSADDSTYAYEEMLEDIDLLIEKYPKHLKLVEVGRSTLGNDIPVLLMGNMDAENKILVQASIHAREYPSTAVLMKHLEVMLYHIDEANSSGKTYDEMLDNIAYYIIPMSNPDGSLLSQMGEISIADEVYRQKVIDIRNNNISDCDSYEFSNYFVTWKSNINGVDLNRNFDAGWEMVHDFVCKPSAEGYKGPFVFSEEESKLIKKYLDLSEIKLTVSYHTSGNLIYWWYYQSGDFANTCRSFALSISDKSGYEVMNKGESRYSHAGVKDYGVTIGKPGITYEIGKYSSPIPPISVYYAAKRTRVLPQVGYWLLREIEIDAEWLNAIDDLETSEIVMPN